MQRYIINEEQIKNNQIILNQEDSFHITKVLRMHVKEQVTCLQDKKAYLCEIAIISDVVTLNIIDQYENNTEFAFTVTIAHGLVNKTKREETIEKLSLLGCNNYFYFPMRRSVVKADKERIDKNLGRNQKIAKEASEVAHRYQIMNCEFLNSLDALIIKTEDYNYKLFAFEETNNLDSNFKKIIKNLKNDDKVVIVIGPEGGIDQFEANKLRENGFIPISLGPRILRTEVAPTYCLAAISYEKELK